MSLKNLKKPDFLKTKEEKEKEAEAKLKLSQLPIVEKSIDAFDSNTFSVKVKLDGTVIIKDSVALLKITPPEKGDVFVETSEGITKITIERPE